MTGLLGQCQPPTLELEAAAEPEKTRKRTEEIDGAFMTILVVDDDEDIREAVEEVLRAEGYATRGVANGQEAQRAIDGAQERPDLILLDLMMPIMDGWDFLFWLDEQSDLRDTPVAIMSAHPSIRRAIDIARSRRGAPKLRLHGGDRLLLPKPLSVLGLLSMVQDVYSERDAPT